MAQPEWPCTFQVWGDSAFGLEVSCDVLDLALDHMDLQSYTAQIGECLADSIATHLCKVFADECNSGLLRKLIPGRVRVATEYILHPGGHLKLLKLNILHFYAELVTAATSHEEAGCTGLDATAPSKGEMCKLIVDRVVNKSLGEIHLKGGKTAATLFGDHTCVLVDYRDNLFIDDDDP